MNQRLLISFLIACLLSLLGPVDISAQEDFRILCGPYLQKVNENEAKVMWITNHKVHYGKVAATDVYTRKPYRFTTLDYIRPSTFFAVINDIHADHETFSALMETQEDKKWILSFLTGIC